eukprot:1153848-Prymnesium_polylepis.1
MEPSVGAGVVYTASWTWMRRARSWADVAWRSIDTVMDSTGVNECARCFRDLDGSCDSCPSCGASAARLASLRSCAPDYEI